MHVKAFLDFLHQICVWPKIGISVKIYEFLVAYMDKMIYSVADKEIIKITIGEFYTLHRWKDVNCIFPTHITIQSHGCLIQMSFLSYLHHVYMLCLFLIDSWFIVSWCIYFWWIHMLPEWQKKKQNKSLEAKNLFLPLSTAYEDYRLEISSWLRAVLSDWQQWFAV